MERCVAGSVKFVLTIDGKLASNIGGGGLSNREVVWLLGGRFDL